MKDESRKPGTGAESRAEWRELSPARHASPVTGHEFVDVAGVAEIPDAGTLSVTLPTGEQVCLVRCGAAIGALLDQCTHQAMPLSAGEVLPDGTIQCAWHGARFDCCSGAVREGPAEDDVRAFDVRVVGGRVLVRPGL